MHSRFQPIVQLVFRDLAGSIVWFPVWWYTTGFLWVSGVALRTLRYRAAQYGMRVWLKNFFVPMYGQYDIVGRMVSVFMRTIVFIGRSIALFVEGLVYALGLVLWCLTPPLCVIFIVMNILRGAFFDQVRSIV